MDINIKSISRVLSGLTLLLSLQSFAYAQHCQPLANFTDQNNGTITDPSNGLMWKQCTEGQQGDRCTGKAQLYSWSLASQHAQTSQFAGYGNWRLPTLTELKSLVEQDCGSPAININLFPGTPSAGLWTNNDDNLNAWSVDFSKGNAVSVLKAGGKYIRLVRNL